MSVRYKAPAVFVPDMAAARAFYEGVLGQTVVMDLGVYMVFAGEFSLWQKDAAREMIFGKAGTAFSFEPGGLELYFECPEPEAALERVRAASAPLVHGMVEQPWGQRCFRVLDPCGHLVEVAEPMFVVVRRALAEGSEQEASRKTMMPLEYVQAVARGEITE
ncbi:VOC family protein [Desulfovibrio aminophilus]|nr:VOC family protein [Desulfovibrio aminophilus]MCM0756821.1 VOC family protein [Desulfovibrio aminophilus]